MSEAEAIAESVAYLRERGQAFKIEAEKFRRDARELEIRASERFDAFISFDLAADRLAASIPA